MLSLTGHNYIGGERRAAGTVEHKSLDASSGEALPYTFIQATPEEVDAAAQAAAAAYPTYRNLSAVRRAEFLEAIADEIDGDGILLGWILRARCVSLDNFIIVGIFAGCAPTISMRKRERRRFLRRWRRLLFGDALR